MKATLARNTKLVTPEKGCLPIVKAQMPLSECCAFLFAVEKTYWREASIIISILDGNQRSGKQDWGVSRHRNSPLVGSQKTWK